MSGRKKLGRHLPDCEDDYCDGQCRSPAIRGRTVEQIERAESPRVPLDLDPRTNPHADPWD